MSGSAFGAGGDPVTPKLAAIDAQITANTNELNGNPPPTDQRALFLTGNLVRLANDRKDIAGTSAACAGIVSDITKKADMLGSAVGDTGSVGTADTKNSGQ